MLQLLTLLRSLHLRAAQEERQYPSWHLSSRFRKTPEDQLSTMVEMVKALAEITRLSQDYSVSTAMNSFKRYFKGELAGSKPSEIFFDVIESCKELELDATGELEHVFIDLCYYDYPALVQNALQFCARCIAPSWSLSAAELRPALPGGTSSAAAAALSQCQRPPASSVPCRTPAKSLYA